MKFIKYIIYFLACLIVGVLGILYVTTRGVDREYQIDLNLPSYQLQKPVGQLKVGVAVRDITPNLQQYDTWTDVDKNSAFDPKVDRYEDRNKNGTFDFVWLAGFGEQRPAQKVHDPLWSRALAFSNHGNIVVLVSIDSVGMTYDQFIPIRKRLYKKLPKLSHVVFASTHSHQAPDTIGLWSYDVAFDSRFDHQYVKLIQDKVYESVVEAVENLQEADTIIAEAHVPQKNFSQDARPPIVVDHKLPVAWFRNKKTKKTIATFASWGMHPEGFGEHFLGISSDFVHYFREAMEKGLKGKDGFKGFGGKAVYFSGPVGGLMTQLEIDITDRFGKSHGEDHKSQAQGENLAILAANALLNEQHKQRWEMKEQTLAVAAKTIYVPVGSPLKYAVILGLVHPGTYGLPWSTKVRTEINAIRIGEIEILTTPGEIYPEIIDGGIESPLGADIDTPPVEVPPLRSLMRGKINMNFNLSMDELGYLIPISQWDREPPYTYDYKEAPYGEVYVGDPNVTPSVHRHSMSLLDRLHHNHRWFTDEKPEGGVDENHQLHQLEQKIDVLLKSQEQLNQNYQGLQQQYKELVKQNKPTEEQPTEEQPTEGETADKKSIH